MQRFYQLINKASANPRSNEGGARVATEGSKGLPPRRYIAWKGLVFCISGLSCLLATRGHAQLIVAHRGASHAAPENTSAAFELAWQQNADAIEADFRLSRDGQIVCIHDATTQRTAGVDRIVAQSTLAELKALDVGAWKDPQFKGQRILTLEEVLEMVPRGKKIFVELKTGPEIVKPLKDVVTASRISSGQILVITFNEETAREVKRVIPNLKVHWLTGYEDTDRTSGGRGGINRIADSLSRTRADGLGSEANREIFNDSFIQNLTENGLKEFHVWTVDNAKDAEYYQSLGAFSITTNRPGFIRKKLKLDKPQKEDD